MHLRNIGNAYKVSSLANTPAHRGQRQEIWMPSITTAALQALAEEQMLDLRKRADDYLQRAIAAAGTDKARVYAGMIDDLVNITTLCGGLDLACQKARDFEAAAAIHALQHGTAAALAHHAYTARMVSIPGWCWVNQCFTPAAQVAA